MKDKYTIVVRHLKTGETKDVKVAASNLDLTVRATALTMPGKTIKFTAQDVELMPARHTSRRLDVIKHDMHTRALAAKKSKRSSLGVMFDTTHHIKLSQDEFKQLVDERIELRFAEYTEDLKLAKLRYEAAQTQLDKHSKTREAWKKNKDRVKYLGYVTEPQGKKA